MHAATAAVHDRCPGDPRSVGTRAVHAPIGAGVPEVAGLAVGITGTSPTFGGEAETIGAIAEAALARVSAGTATVVAASAELIDASEPPAAGLFDTAGPAATGAAGAPAHSKITGQRAAALIGRTRHSLGLAGNTCLIPASAIPVARHVVWLTGAGRQAHPALTGPAGTGGPIGLLALAPALLALFAGRARLLLLSHRSLSSGAEDTEAAHQ